MGSPLPQLQGGQEIRLGICWRRNPTENARSITQHPGRAYVLLTERPLCVAHPSPLADSAWQGWGR